MELKGENPFKARAYEKAARSLAQSDYELDELIDRGHLSQLAGIGEAIGKKIHELYTKGTLDYYERLKASIPPGHLEMLKIPSLGPRKIKTLYDKLGIQTIGELEYACKENRLLDLPGFGKKTQENILTGISHLKRYRNRHLFSEVIVQAEELIKKLSQADGVVWPTIAGSLRRAMEVVKDIDLLVSSGNPVATAKFFASLSEVDAIVAMGDTKVSVTLKTGINCDLRIVTEKEFPYALLHFTGSKDHNTALRRRAKERNLKLNEYGLFRGEENLPCTTEEEIYGRLNLPYIPPELREDLGEIEAAEMGAIPDLVERKDIRGVFHIHSNYSDGTSSIGQFVREAKKRGWDYLGIADHSRAAYYASGLSGEKIKRQQAEIDELNARNEGFYIFKGIEADILPDGHLDYDEEILASFDFVIAAVHSHFHMGIKEMTQRIIKALENPFTTMLAHPTGRLLLAREPYAVDINEIIAACAQWGKIIELNASPYRLDLDWRNLIHAKKRGVKIAINPDAHHIEALDDVFFGINIARKGWLTKEDCINCLPLETVKKLLKK